MTIIQNKSFGGERPLFGIKDTRLENVTITDGESGIKCCQNIEADGCRFIGKYPWWHVDGSLITNCYFEVGSRSAIWYSNNMTMRNCTIDAPKLFREMKDLTLENVIINDADETFWNIDGLRIKNVTLHDGTYPFMYCRNVYVDCLSFNFCLISFILLILFPGLKAGCKNTATHRKGTVNCHIAGEQPLCYAEGLVIENSSFDVACDRAFEDSNVQATIKGHITEIKNPRTGHISADSIGKITYDEFAKAPHDCVIEEKKI